MRGSTQDGFGSFAKKIEKLLIRLTFLGLFSLFIFQILLVNDDIRRFLSLTEKLEGEEIESSLPAFGSSFSEEEIFGKEDISGTITIALLDEESKPEVELIINGYVVAFFEEAQIKLKVYDGDIIEISPNGYKQALHFKIINTENLIMPVKGKEIIVEGESALVGEIKVKKKEKTEG